MNGGNLTVRSRTEVLPTVLQELKSRQGDVKATVLINQAIENGVQTQDILVRLDSYFERQFNREIDNVDIVEDESTIPFLEVSLTKAGFYDLLPEGLFFQPELKSVGRSNQLNVAEEVFKYRRDKKKERAIRSFFQPFENEFFKQETAIENKEAQLLHYFRTPRVDIWDFPKKLTRQDKISLALLIPHALTINGDIALMSKSLSLLLKEEVNIKLCKKRFNIFPDPLALGDFSLGNNMICGDVFSEESLILRYEIGPLQNYSIEDFLGGAYGEVLVETFNRFFAPVDASVEIEVLVDRAQQKTMLSGGSESILGYTMFL